MNQEYIDFASIIDAHAEELATRKRGYVDRLIRLYSEQFPEARKFERKVGYEYIRVWRISHPAVEKRHARGYEYFQEWLQNSPKGMKYAKRRTTEEALHN
jgi:hypothetical protein